MFIVVVNRLSCLLCVLYQKPPDRAPKIESMSWRFLWSSHFHPVSAIFDRYLKQLLFSFFHQFSRLFLGNVKTWFCEFRRHMMREQIFLLHWTQRNPLSLIDLDSLVVSS